MPRIPINNAVPVDTRPPIYLKIFNEEEIGDILLEAIANQIPFPNPWNITMVVDVTEGVGCTIKLTVKGE